MIEELKLHGINDIIFKAVLLLLLLVVFKRQQHFISLFMIVGKENIYL